MEKKSKYIFYFLIVLSFLFLILNVNSFILNLKLLISFIFNPSFAYSGIDKFKGVSDRFKIVVDCQNEVNNLKNEVKLLREKLLELEPLAQETQKIKLSIGVSDFKGYSGVYASVISYNPYDPYSFFYINKGAKDQINLYNPVLFFDNNIKRWRIVGRVVEIYSNYSKVSLITSPGFSFIAMSSKSKGLISAEKGKIFYKYIEGEFENGESLFTADTSFTFPGYFYIGEIKESKINADSMFSKAIVSFIDIKDISYVYVLNWQPYLIKEKI